MSLNGAHMLTKFMLKHSKGFIFSYAWRRQAAVEENELLDYCRSVIRSVVEYACPAWLTGITKGQSESLEQIQKCAIYIIAPHLQYKEATTKFNLPTIKEHLDILNSILFRNIVDSDPHRPHYLIPKPYAVKRTLCSTSKYEHPKCSTNWFKTSFIPYTVFKLLNTGVQKLKNCTCIKFMDRCLHSSIVLLHMLF